MHNKNLWRLIRNFIVIVAALSMVGFGKSSEPLKFTYLDHVDPSIKFHPVMFTNQFAVNDDDKIEYCIFSSKGNQRLPGYEGKRCIVEYEMALELRKMQAELSELSPYILKVFDTYRPQQAVDFFGKWIQESDDLLVKKYHYPNIDKLDFQDLSYIAKRASHSLGTAIDLTIALTEEKRGLIEKQRPDGFLGIFDPTELDVGNVGYLAFDTRSSHEYSDLSEIQIENRKMLLGLVEKHHFIKIRAEFWHYFYKRDRNKTTYFNFPIRDN